MREKTRVEFHKLIMNAETENPRDRMLKARAILPIHKAAVRSLSFILIQIRLVNHFFGAEETAISK